MNRKRTLLLVMAATFALGGIAQYFFPEYSAASRILTVVHSLAMTVLCASWCQADAAERGGRVSRAMLWLIVLFPPLGLLVHLFRTRSTGRGIRATVLAALLLVLFLLLWVIGYLAMEVVFGEGLAVLFDG